MVAEWAYGLQQIPEETQRFATLSETVSALNAASFNEATNPMSSRSLDRPGTLRLETLHRRKKENVKSHHRLQSLNSILHCEFRPTPAEELTTMSGTKSSTSSSAVALLASCRHSIRRSETEPPTVPTRTTSAVRPTKRKRHDDYVAFHRQSCQLFSSLDSAMVQMRLSTSSSSTASSTSSSRSSTASITSSTSSTTPSPVLESSTRDTSIEVNVPTPGIESPIMNREITKSSKCNRPPLQRMPYTVPPQPTVSIFSAADRTDSQMTRTSQSPEAPDLSQLSTSSLSLSGLTPRTTTQPCYSSQIRLPHPPTRTSTSITNTTIHWTSPETRAREYAKIDAANSGFRLFLRRVCPHTLARKVGGGRTGFWDDDISHSDLGQQDWGEEQGDDCGGSVRRYRVKDVVEVCGGAGSNADTNIDEKKEDRDSRENFIGGRRTLSWISFLGRTRSVDVDPYTELDDKRGEAEARLSISMLARRMSSFRF